MGLKNYFVKHEKTWPVQSAASTSNISQNQGFLGPSQKGAFGILRVEGEYFLASYKRHSTSDNFAVNRNRGVGDAKLVFAY